MALGGLSVLDELIGEPLATSTPSAASDVRNSSVSMKRCASDAVDDVACAAKRNGTLVSVLVVVGV